MGRASETEVASGCLETAVCFAFFEQPTARNAPRSKSRLIPRLVDMARSLWRSAEVRHRLVPGSVGPRGRRIRTCGIGIRMPCMICNEAHLLSLASHGRWRVRWIQGTTEIMGDIQ